MSKFIKVRAMKLIQFRDKPEPLETIIIPIDKISIGYPEHKRLWLKGIGEYAFEEAEWARIVEILTEMQEL